MMVSLAPGRESASYPTVEPSRHREGRSEGTGCLWPMLHEGSMVTTVMWWGPIRALREFRGVERAGPRYQTHTRQA